MEYKEAASKAGRTFVPVYLICNVDKNLRRVATPDHLHSRTMKLTDIQLARDLHSRCELFRFNDCAGLTVNSTDVSPLETSAKILASLQNRRDDAL